MCASKKSAFPHLIVHFESSGIDHSPTFTIRPPENGAPKVWKPQGRRQVAIDGLAQLALQLFSTLNFGPNVDVELADRSPGKRLLQSRYIKANAAKVGRAYAELCEGFEASKFSEVIGIIKGQVRFVGRWSHTVIEIYVRESGGTTDRITKGDDPRLAKLLREFSWNSLPLVVPPDGPICKPTLAQIESQAGEILVSDIPDRKDLLNWIEESLSRRRGVFLSGPPGVGKTTIALGSINRLLSKSGGVANEHSERNSQIGSGGKRIVFQRVYCLFRKSGRSGRYEKFLRSESGRSNAALKVLKDYYTWPKELNFPDNGEDTGLSARTLFVIDGWNDEIEQLLHLETFRDAKLLITSTRSVTSIFPRGRIDSDRSSFECCEVRSHPFLSDDTAIALLSERGVMTKTLIKGRADLRKKFVDYADVVRRVPLALLSSGSRISGTTLDRMEASIDALLKDALRAPLERPLPTPPSGGYRSRLRELLAAVHANPEIPSSNRQAIIFVATAAWLSKPSLDSQVPISAMPDLSENTRTDLAALSVAEFPKVHPGESPVVVIPQFIGRELLWHLSSLIETQEGQDDSMRRIRDDALDLLRRSLGAGFAAVLPDEYDEAGKWPSFLNENRKWDGERGVRAGRQLFEAVATMNRPTLARDFLHQMNRLARRLIAYHCARAETFVGDSRDHELECAQAVAHMHSQFVDIQIGNRELHGRIHRSLSSAFAALAQARFSGAEKSERLLLKAYEHTLVASYPGKKAQGEQATFSGSWAGNVDLDEEWAIADAKNWNAVVRGKMAVLRNDLDEIERVVIEELSRDKVWLSLGSAWKNYKLTNPLWKDRIAELTSEINREFWRFRCIVGWLLVQLGERNSKYVRFWDHAESLKKRTLDPTSMEASLLGSELNSSPPFERPTFNQPLSFDERLFLALAATAARRTVVVNSDWLRPEIDREIVLLNDSNHFTILDPLYKIILNALRRCPGAGLNSDQRAADAGSATQ